MAPRQSADQIDGSRRHRPQKDERPRAAASKRHGLGRCNGDRLLNMKVGDQGWLNSPS